MLYGKSGVGKTSFAKAHGNYPLVVSTLDDLKKINVDKTDLLIFDDMEFSEWMPEKVIHLLDIENSRSFKSRHTDAQIPKGMKRIFSTNMDPPDAIFPPGKNEEQQAAIDRRFVKHGPITEELFRQLKPGEIPVRRLVKKILKAVVMTGNRAK
eukprot:203487-Prymnesium_polylepis.1